MVAAARIALAALLLGACSDPFYVIADAGVDASAAPDMTPLDGLQVDLELPTPRSCGPAGKDGCCQSPIVPGGTFNRSNDAHYPATVSTFRLDAYEVTVGRFRQFVAAGGGTQASPPPVGAGATSMTGTGWDPAWNAMLPTDSTALATALKCDPMHQAWTDSPGPNEALPITCANWYTAFAFCAWDGGRLPTEAEWNYAAAGGDEQRVYPWSQPSTSTTIDATYAVYNCPAGCSALADISPPGSKSPQGDARWGQSDLAGNMYEWVMDSWSDSYGIAVCVDCVNVTPGSDAVLRGGSFNYGSDRAQTDARFHYNAKDGRFAFTGIRCARSP